MSRPEPGSDYVFAPEERPLFPGSPYSPRHTTQRRIGYALVAVLMAIVASLGNALVTVNIPNLAGALGVYTVEASLLPAAFVAMNACANLLLIKARQQFGIPAITHTLLVIYAAAALAQMIIPGFGMALVVRGVSGMAAAGLTTMTIYCLLQVVPPAKRPAALVAGISLGQFGSPLARLFPIEMLALGGWQGLHLVEAGLALAALAALLALPLPPSDKTQAFEPLDFVTVALVVPAVSLICAVLGVGRLAWWTDTPWIGVALAVAVPLLVAALVIEHNRARPLLQTKWIGSLDIARLAIVALLVRLALAEQTYGAVGLLTSAGLTNDQLHTLFGFVLLAMAIGLAVTLATISPDRIPYLIIAASLIIALGAGLDTSATNLTRPAQLIWSQALIAFGTMLFIGPALAYGFLRMLERGPSHLVTFIVLFSTTQNLGGLAGSALLGTYQVVAARGHATALAEKVLPADPAVAARLQAGAQGLSGAITDPVARAAQGAGALGQALVREANILAFNDVFRLVAALAVLTALYVIYIRVFNTIRRRRAAQGAAP
ncbi:MAG: MFS transporter [Alphaproteobacteria bacterium]|nr:MFS transporter [Alphaproteobacteria bacterium]MBU1515324.1 MFS transporter [Alphaproteobacteria bacterium]MBU2095374.1 MFS transporter [Alphaproteobacteria bacterium]MBU2152606.1 MFS transporter [Alphaproteobacteria bacterium]MBU2310002.1 MFS transporter [Alphaproteobacteria bacterium]